MSRIGKQIITIPSGTDVTVTDGIVKVKGKQGELTHEIPTIFTVNIADNQLSTTVAEPENVKQIMQWGTHTSIIANMIEGVNDGFKKELELVGVGFKVALQGKKLVLNLGFSHPIEFELPDGIKAEVDKNKITISGIDKQLVGHVAAKIRSFKKPEPYKGKGIKYVDEQIRRKAGKAAGGE